MRKIEVPAERARTLASTIEHLIVQTPAGRTEVLPGGWVVGAERDGVIGSTSTKSNLTRSDRTDPSLSART